MHNCFLFTMFTALSVVTTRALAESRKPAANSIGLTCAAKIAAWAIMTRGTF
jgi:hypothetical protein